MKPPLIDEILRVRRYTPSPFREPPALVLPSIVVMVRLAQFTDSTKPVCPLPLRPIIRKTEPVRGVFVSKRFFRAKLRALTTAENPFFELIRGIGTPACAPTQEINIAHQAWPFMPYQRPYLVRFVRCSFTPICEAANRNIARTSSTLTIRESPTVRVPGTALIRVRGLRTTGFRTTLAARVTVFFLATTAAPTVRLDTTRLGEPEARFLRLFTMGRARRV